jgi:hypothetical protein
MASSVLAFIWFWLAAAEHILSYAVDYLQTAINWLEQDG